MKTNQRGGRGERLDRERREGKTEMPGKGTY